MRARKLGIPGIRSFTMTFLLVVCVYANYAQSSSDNLYWPDKTVAGSEPWSAMASSSDGSHLVACIDEGGIFTAKW